MGFPICPTPITFFGMPTEVKSFLCLLLSLCGLCNFTHERMVGAGSVLCDAASLQVPRIHEDCAQLQHDRRNPLSGRSLHVVTGLAQFVRGCVRVTQSRRVALTLQAGDGNRGARSSMAFHCLTC